MAKRKENTVLTKLRTRIKKRRATLSVIGLGYVGLPLAVEMAKAGLRVYGIDVDLAKVGMVNRGKSYVQDVSDADLRAVVRQGRLTATSDYSVLRRSDAIDICVPTPLRKTKDPDISYIIDAVEHISRYLKRGQLIILESTTYPGTTEEVILTRLEQKKLRVGEDFFLAFSPERVDPGNPTHKTANIPKVVGGITHRCTTVACDLYRTCIDSVVPVSSTTVAEMVKLLENTFRSVNIGLVNEMCLMCDRMGIDVWEVIEAAATKPFGFLKFLPGPGLGGHCIPIDPFYLSWKAKMAGFEPRFIELAGQINASMPDYVVAKVADALNESRKSLKGSKVLILGVAYKANVNDTRESPAIDIMRELGAKGAKVSFADPHVREIRVDGTLMRASRLSPKILKSNDCAVIVADHAAFDYGMIVRGSRAIVDTRNALRKYRARKIKRI
ncbi:MAG: nucleotide sugar dehydrogenase [Candidatus Eisenbacteria bacterium]